MYGEIGLSFISSNKSTIPLTSRSIILSSFLISGGGGGNCVFQALFGGIYTDDERLCIKRGNGGVLFIDEAYALGNKEKRDSFAKECIDTLCEGLSDHKDQLMVIIAGYETDLKNCFFAYNQGLNSRFPWRFKTDDYKAPELNKIFQKKINDAGWSLKEEIPDKWFESKMDTFTFYGRDMETLLAKTKIAHGRRVFCKPKEEKMKLTMKDIKRGYDMFIDNNEVKERNNKNCHIEHMYL